MREHHTSTNYTHFEPRMQVYTIKQCEQILLTRPYTHSAMQTCPSNAALCSGARGRMDGYTMSLYAPSCMYKGPGILGDGSTKLLTKLSPDLRGSSAPPSLGVRHHVGDSASTKVCHQPHDTFSGWYPSTGTMQGTFRSMESPRPSCTHAQLQAQIRDRSSLSRCSSGSS